MNWTRMGAVGTACAGALIATISLVNVANSAGPIAPERAGISAEAGRVMPAMFGGGRHGGWHGRGKGRMCAEGRMEAKAETMIEYGAGLFNFTPSQQTAFDKLADTVRGGAKSMGATCRIGIDKHDAPTPERLAFAEQAMETALAQIKQIRPAFDAFYATLDADQRKVVDNLHPRHRGFRGRHGKD